MIICREIRKNLVGGVSLAAPNMTNEVRHIARKFLYFLIFLVFVFPQISNAVSLKQRQFGESTGGAYYSDYDYGTMDIVPGTDGMSEMEVVSTLRHDIQALDEQIATCERKRKGWVAATVVCCVGVAATGIAAIVQHNKIQDKKAELENVKSDVAETKQQVDSARKDLDKLQQSQQGN